MYEQLGWYNQDFL